MLVLPFYKPAWAVGLGGLLPPPGGPPGFLKNVEMSYLLLIKFDFCYFFFRKGFVYFGFYEFLKFFQTHTSQVTLSMFLTDTVLLMASFSPITNI
jgi:hypothetical protein